MRNIFIIGLGNFGFYLAAKLEGKSRVTAIDIDRDKIQRIGPMVSRAVVGDATSRELLRELGIDSAEVAVVSVGESMEKSILITHHLKELNVKKIYSKAISEEHAEILRMIGATRVLQPEREVAENLAMSITKPTIVDYLQLHKNFGIIEVDAPDKFAGHSLADLALRSEYGVTAIGIFRKGDRLVNPAPETLILRGDRLVLLGNEEDIAEFEASLR